WTNCSKGLLLLLILILRLLYPLCFVLFPLSDHKPITAESGQNVTLTCRAPNKDITAIEWKRADLGEEYVLVYRQKHFDTTEQHPSFKNRVDLQDRQMKDGDMSLIVNNVTTTDNGTYECRVYTRGENQNNAPETLICSINLTVDPPGDLTWYLCSLFTVWTLKALCCYTTQDGGARCCSSLQLSVSVLFSFL
uniref:Ig-like domain-containing protein n=1 Tax=Pundamilia nyererei TaxID=303518 RepID=A0A3B4ERX2_9CICH